MIGKVIIVGVVVFVIFGFILPIQENDISEQITGTTIGEVTKYTPEEQVIIDNIIDTEPNETTSVKIDRVCDELYPNGFTNVILDYDNVINYGTCFPISTLDTLSCDDKKLLSGNILEICIADIYLGTRSGLFNGIQTDSNGLAFIELDCNIGSKWAECQAQKGFPLFSFIP